MTPTPHERAENVLGRFERTLEEARAELEGRSAPPHAARTLLQEMRTLEHVSAHLERTGEETPSIRTGVERARSQYDGLLEEHGDVYATLLEDELHDLVQRYPQVVCSIFDRTEIGMETYNDLDTRDTIEMCLQVLDDRDLGRLETRIDALDDVLWCKYRRAAAEIGEHETEIARPYRPDRYWWRHPEDVFDA